MGMKPTKMGHGDKQTGYIVGQSNVRKLGIFLISMSILFIMVGLGLKGDIDTEKEAQQVYSANVRQNKKVLFRARHHEMADSKQEEMKLVKVLTMMQAHFGRDRRERTHLVAMKEDLASAIQQHDKGTQLVLRQVQANKEVYSYMKKNLESSNYNFHKQTDALIQQYGNDLRQEGLDAEGRLKTLTQTVLDELSSEIAEEHREKKEEQELERQDPQWKELKNNAKDKDWNTESKDEKDVEMMLQQLYDKTMNVKEPTSPRKLIEIARKLGKEYDFAPSLHGGKTKAKLEKQIRKLLTAVKYMPRINKYTVSKNKLSTIFYAFVAHLEESWDSYDRMRGVLPTLRPILEQWNSNPRKMSTTDAMLKVEELVKARKVRAVWLMPDEEDEEHFMRFSTKDHKKDEGIEPVLIKDQRFKPQAKPPAAN